MTTIKDQSQELQGISRTLLIPLYFRALENKYPNPHIWKYLKTPRMCLKMMKIYRGRHA